VSDLSRRGFLGAAAAVTGAAVVGPALPDAQAAKPRRHRDIRDVRHVVILMQENRSFDHYFGSMAGVRGFGDRSTITLPGGLSVFQQPTTAPGKPITTTQFPWHLSDAPASAYPSGNQPPNSEVGAQGYGGTAHSWADQHGAWNGGLMNGWVSAKDGLTTLGHLDRGDIPFHYALADAYTVGDAYHCSVLSATGPNRTFLWSGTIDAQRKYSDFVANDGGDEIGKNLLWPTYAETLQGAGVSWHVYQCADDYGDNASEYFKTFAQYDPTQGGTAAPGNVYYDNGVANVPEPLTGIRANTDNLANAIKADAVAGKLPQVSWVVTNQAFSEHPDGAPNDGAYYINGVLNALNADPDVFNSTLVIVDYDENDGQFDHVPPPTPAPGATDEFYDDLPVGLGFRVPLILISPWTRGGWVTSEVSDHTSVIQLLEIWTTAIGTPAISPNISSWRRRVCSDLTNAFDFTAPVYGLPKLPATTVIGDPPGGAYNPPTTTNAMPKQEPGTKRARPLPNLPNANLDGIFDGHAQLSFSNIGRHVRKASHFAVYDNVSRANPTQYTVDAGDEVNGSIDVGTGKYDLTVVGPNRFLRHFTGNGTAPARVTATYVGAGLLVEFSNNGGKPVTFTVSSNNYAPGRPRTYHLNGHGKATHVVALRDGWYDVSVTITGEDSWSRRYIGHLEDGHNSVSG
jgi:phospholipase C